MLTPGGCQRRQRRFRERLADERIDAAVISDPRDIHYLTGVLPSAFPSLLYLTTDGGSWLLGHTDEGTAAVDARLTYEYHQLFTMNPDPLQCLAAVLERHVQGAPSVGRLGWQREALPRLIGNLLEDTLHPRAWVGIDTLLTDIQQQKEPDEIALLRKSIACASAGYAAAERAIAPGVSELEVLAAAHRAATLEAGEPLHVGGDFRCAEFGGPARPHAVQPGDLYIIDLQTTYRGYWSDQSRAYTVTEPTDLQASVYAHLAAVLTEVPDQVRPGGSARALWRWLDARIREHPHLATSGLIHHGGHGVGTRGHEAPDINRDRDGIFAVGNVFSCEPGAYSPQLRAGIRLEHMFLITETGVETLSTHPLDIRAALA